MIRNIIMRQMSVNRYGLFQFLKRNVSEHQKQFLELKSQYKITQNIDQQIEILKGIVKVRHQIDVQDNISLETIESYYNFIRDYQTCRRKGLKINKETTELYNQVYQTFTDQTIFDKIKNNSMYIQSTGLDINFLQFNSLIYLLQKKYESGEYGSITDIAKKIVDILEELNLQISGSIQLQVQILDLQQAGYLLLITGSFKEAETLLKEGLDQIKQLKQYYDDNSIEITQSDKEWLLDKEVFIFECLANIYDQLNQNESCIEYQDKALQLIKEHEGISYYYVHTLYYLNNQFGQLNFYRQLKIIEETCSNLEKNEQYLLMQFQRLKVLYQLDQLNSKEYDRIIKLHQEVQIIDDNFHTAFYGMVLVYAIHLKKYSDINKWIDLLFSSISNITYNQVDVVVSVRKTLYKEFLNKQLNHNINLYEKTMSDYQEKAYPFLSEIQKQFAENYFNYNEGRQTEIRYQIVLILRDYLTRSTYGNDHHLIRVALEQTFMLFQNGPMYRESILMIFKKLNNTINIPPQIKSQLSKYIQQLEQNSDK